MSISWNRSVVVFTSIHFASCFLRFSYHSTAAFNISLKDYFPLCSCSLYTSHIFMLRFLLVIFLWTSVFNGFSDVIFGIRVSRTVNKTGRSMELTLLYEILSNISVIWSGCATGCTIGWEDNLPSSLNTGCRSCTTNCDICDEDNKMGTNYSTAREWS